MAAPGRSQIGVSRGCCRWVPKKIGGGQKNRLWLRDLAVAAARRRSLRFLVNCAVDSPRVLVGWPFPLGFGMDGRLLLARRWRVYV